MHVFISLRNKNTQLILSNYTIEIFFICITIGDGRVRGTFNDHTYAIASDVHLIEKGLLARGYPLRVLSTISIGAKEELYRSGSTFDRATIQTYDLESGETEKQELVAGQVSPAPCGQIKTEHLSLTFIIGTGEKGIKNISFHYEWKLMPLSRFSDPIGLSWDENLFYAKDETFSKVDFFTYLSDLPDNNFGIRSEQHGYAKGGPSGVTWFADLRGHYTSYQTMSLFGYGFISLVPRTAHGQSQLFAHYVHAKLSVGVTMSVPSFGSFTVSGGSFNDEMGTQTTIAW